MIEAVFKKENEQIVSFNIEGHANYAEHGEDLVCSAVSAISLTIANGITEVLMIKAEPALKDGFLSIDLTHNSEDDKQKSQVLLKTLFISLMQLANDKFYGNYISVKEEEV